MSPDVSRLCMNLKMIKNYREFNCKYLYMFILTYIITIHSILTLIIDLKHSMVGSGGRWPKCKKSLSCNHWGRWLKWITFHDCNLCLKIHWYFWVYNNFTIIYKYSRIIYYQIAMANSSACSAAFIIMFFKSYPQYSSPSCSSNWLIGTPVWLSSCCNTESACLEMVKKTSRSWTISISTTNFDGDQIINTSIGLRSKE